MKLIRTLPEGLGRPVRVTKEYRVGNIIYVEQEGPEGRVLYKYDDTERRNNGSQQER